MAIYGGIITEAKINDKINPEPIKNIVFDLGNVLVHNTLKYTAQDTKIPQEYFEALFFKFAEVSNSSAKTETTTYSQFKKMYKDALGDTLKEYADEAIELIIASNVAYVYTKGLIMDLKSAGYKVYYLSNWDKASFTATRDRGCFGFLDLMDGGVVSYQVGCMKPDKKIYDIFLKKYNLKANECIFFDDKEENVNAAIAVGMQSKVWDIDGKMYNELVSTLLSSVTEAKLTYKDRNNLSDSTFGIPEDRKFPLNDKDHVEQAIKMFSRAEDSKKPELAKRIKSAASKYGVSISKDSKVAEYLNEASNTVDYKIIGFKDKSEISKYDANKYLKMSSNGAIAVDIKTNKIIGHVLVTKFKGGFGGLEVDKKYRGQGIGTALLKYIMKEYNADHMWVYADNDNAIKIYKKLGFKVIIKDKTDNGREYYGMSLHGKHIDADDFVTKNVNEMYIEEASTDGQVIYPIDKKKNYIKDEYIVTDVDGIENRCLKINGYNFPFRGRSEIMIIRGNKMFIQLKPDGSYKIPGGGWDTKDNDRMESAVREAEEEAYIETKNVRHCCTYIKLLNEVRDWVKRVIPDSKDWWKGYYTELYIADYDKPFRGKVDKLDQDDIKNKGGWVDISVAFSYLDKPHQDFLISAGYNIQQENTIPDLGYDLSYKYPLPEIVPYFTPEEMESMGVFNENPDDNFYGVLSNDEEAKKWFDTYKYTGHPGTNYIHRILPIIDKNLKEPSYETKQKLLEYGWNPEITFSDKVRPRLEQTRDKLLERYSVNVISLIEDAHDDTFILNAKDIQDLFFKTKDEQDKSIYPFLDRYIIYMDIEYNEDGNINIGKYHIKDHEENKERVLTVLNNIIGITNRKLFNQGRVLYQIQELEPDDYTPSKGFITVIPRQVAGDDEVIES